MSDLDTAIARARSGDPEALTEMVRLGHRQVWRMCQGMVGREAADDVSQDALLRCIRALPDFRGDCSGLTWVLSITRRACMDELRSRSREERRQAAAASNAATLPSYTPDSSQSVIVKDLLDKLDDDRRLAFVLTQFVRLSYAEAAVVCDCPVGTIRSRVARAREDLIGLVDGDYGRRPQLGSAE